MTTTEQETTEVEAEQTTPSTEETTEVEQAEPDSFPRAYVEELRKEAAEARVKAKRTDELAAALWTARVAATGRLADPTDVVMPEDADPLDEDALTAAVDDLLARKPHLASRRPRGDVGQGMAGSSTTTDLAGMLRSRA